MSHRSYENYGVAITQDHRHDNATDTAGKTDTSDEFEDFYVCQQKEVVIRPVWQPQADTGPFEKETSDGRTYTEDNPAASHDARMGHSGRNK